jgi:hypothetical protein
LVTTYVAGLRAVLGARSDEQAHSAASAQAG